MSKNFFNIAEHFWIQKSLNEGMPKLVKFVNENNIGTIILTERGTRIFKGGISSILKNQEPIVFYRFHHVFSMLIPEFQKKKFQRLKNMKKK